MNNRLKQTICDNLLKIRKARRLSQQELAEVLNMTQPSYRELEIGVRTINAVQLGEIAKFFRIPVNHFYLEGLDPRAEHNTDEVYLEQLKEQLEVYRLTLRIHISRNEELEAKLKRKDRKIDELLTKAAKL
ncbi:helix-turn-helix domain-containing protein [Parapedobacter sp. GCM10030251]|uniref:helix-turn-helix domain-containing protein n=1 Tax=Parapedobacter sp. GCM10030251 TaxID=3273419 RepID=UPI00361123F8